MRYARCPISAAQPRTPHHCCGLMRAARPEKTCSPATGFDHSGKPVIVMATAKEAAKTALVRAAPIEPAGTAHSVAPPPSHETHDG